MLNNPVNGTDPSGHCFGVLGGIDILICAGVVVFVAGTIAAVASSPNSGFNWNDYNWSDWSLPGHLAEEQESPNDSTTAGPYDQLPDPASVGEGKDFTTKQKEDIYAKNRSRNNGVLVDDYTGALLDEPQKSRSGIAPSPNEAQVDHYVPKNGGGTNSYKNARVTSRYNNRLKSNTPPDEFDWSRLKGPQ